MGKQHIDSASPHVSAGHGASVPALHTPTPNANPQPAAVTPSLCTRTDAVEAAILDAITTPSVTCQTATASQLRGITQLDLSNTEIRTLKSGDFAGLTALTTLDLRYARLTALPADIFSPLTNLTNLNLHSNQLASLPATLFNGLTKLHTLDLHNNWLTSLPTPTPPATGTTTYTGLLNHLTALQHLYLYGNRLSSLPAGLLAGLTNLATLNFSSNRISPLPLTLHIAPAAGSDLLTGTSVTAKIALPAGAPQALTIPLTITGGTPISSSLSIAKGATESAAFTITRTGNSTTVVSFGTLPTFLPYNPGLGNVSISGLTLSGTPLTLFNNSKPTFSATPAAATHEQNSRITPRQLPAATGGNGALTYSLTATASNGGTLDNSSKLPTGLAFDDQSRILSGTPTVTGTYSMTYKVQDADTSTGASDEDSRTFALTVTAAATPETPQYTPVCDRTTQVRDALVTAISGVSACAGATATHLLTITSLNLAEKAITSLKAGDFSGLPNLTNLNLHTNQITTLPAGLFADLGELVSLSLRDNLLTSLPANIFQDLTYLRILWLHNNRLGSIDAAAFAGLSALRELYLNNNRLTTLPATSFADLSSLTTLHLGQNRIATLPAPTGSAGTYSGLFNGLRSLERLYLNSNRLTGLNGNSFRGLAELTHLSLRNNRLATLPAGSGGNGFLSDSSKLQSLWLYGNQLSSLPDDLLTGLDSLTELLLHSNAVATFTLPVKIEANPQGSELIVNLILPLPAPEPMAIKVTVDGSDASLGFQNGFFRERAYPFIFERGKTTPMHKGRLQGFSSSANVVLNVVTPLPALGDKFTGVALAASPTLKFGGPSQTLSFGTTTVPPQTYAIGRPIATLTLPAATASTGAPTITYALSPAIPGLLFNGTARTLTGTPTAANPSYEMTYTASSSGYRSASLRFSIDYVANTAPTFEANTTISDQRIKKDEEIAIRLPPAKNGNLPLTYELTGIIKTGTSAGTISNGLPAGLYFNAGERLLSGQPSALGSYTMTYKVTDQDGESATLPSFTLNIVVSKVGTAPTFPAGDIATQYFAQNLTAPPLQLPEASGGDGLLTYSLTPQVPGLTFNPDNRTLTGRATTLGTTRLTYKVADSDSDNAASDTSVKMFDLQVYPAAAFTDVSLDNSEQAHTVGQAGFSLQLPAATGGRGTLSYARTGILPMGLTFDENTRTLAGTPTQAERRLLRWTVTDGEGFKTKISFGVRINTPVVIAESRYTFNLPEKLDGSTNAVEVGEIPVVDPDPNDPLTAMLNSLDNNNFNFIVRKAAPPSINFKLFYEGTGEDLSSIGGNNRDLTLQVSDGVTVATTNIIVTIIAANQKPVAEAGPDQTVIPTSVAAQRVTLDGSGSTDPDNNSLTYAWTAPVAITLSEDTTTAPHFHPHIAAGPYSITLAVTDIPAYSVQPPLTGTDTVTITVGHGTPYFKNASNTVITSQTLSITHGATAGANVGSPVLASDPNGGTIASYSLADTTASSGHAANFQVSNGGQISVASGKTLSTAGDYAVTLTASKGSGDTARSGAIALTLSVVASALPKLTAAISDQSLARGGSQTITLSNHFSDSDSTLTYTATSDNSKVLTVAVSNAGVLTLTAKSDAGGTANVEVTASDGASNVSDSFAVSVANNTPSISTAIADQSDLTIGDSVAITLSDHFTDTDASDILTYSHSLTPPSSAVATVSQTEVGGKPTLTLTAAIKGSLTVAVTATDNGGTASVSDSFALTVTNTPPIAADTIPTQSLALGDSGVAVADLSPYFNDAEGKNTLTYTASSSDTSKVTTSVTGAALTLAAPLNQAAGTATITVTATDDRAKTATQTFTANTTDTAPSFGANTIDARFHVQNQAIAPFQMPAATGGNGTLTYSLSPTVPGLSFDRGNRTLTGTPTTLGTTRLTYTAADSDPNSASSDIATRSFDLQVYAQAAFASNSLDGSTQTHSLNASGFSLQLPTATGGNGTLTYSLGGTPPPGLVFTAATRTLAGTPSTAGSYPLIWKATDAQSVVTSLSFTVLINTVPVFASAPYSFDLRENSDGRTTAIDLGTLSATDADSADSLTWSLKTGDSSKFRVVANTPDRTAKLQYIGGGEDRETTASLSLSVEVADGHPLGVGTAAVTVNVTDVNEKPTAAAGSDQTVTPTSDASQRVTLDGRGSTDPENGSLTYAWTAPAGVTLQSASTARPWFNPQITAGNYDFSLTVTDSDSTTPLSSTPDRVRVTVGHGTPYFKNASNTVITSQSLSAKLGRAAGTSVGSPVLASDPNGGTIASYSLTDTTASSGHAANFQVSTGGQISVASGKTLSTLTSYAVTLTASKGSGATARSSSIALTIAVIASDPPVLSAAISDQSLARGGSSAITLSNHFSDSDSTLTYTATSDNSKVLTVAVSNTGVLTLTAKSDAGGTANVEVTASDGASTASDSFAVSVANNTPTVSTAIADQSNLTIGDSVAITLSDHFTDTDASDTLTYSHSLTPPSSAVATAAQATVDGKPTLTLSVASKGSLTVSVTATDDGGTASVSDSFDLTVTNTTPTTVGKVPTQSLALGSSGVAVADLSQYFNDAEGKNTLTYTASSSDTAKVTTSVTGAALTLAAPLNQAAGTATITVTATDNRNKTATQTFAANTTDTAPSFATTIVDRFHVQGQAIAPFQMPAATGGNGTLTYSLSPSVPGLTFSTGNRTLTGTPTTLGTTRLTYTAADSDPNSASSDIATLSFDLQVYAQAAFASNSLNGSTQTHSLNASGFSLQLPTATGGNGTLTYSLTGTRPPGLAFTAANRTLAGTPSTAGSYPLTWKATDAQSVVTSLGFTVLINTVPAFASDPYSFSLSENSDGRTNAIDLGTLSATDADSADSLTWSLKTGDSRKFRVVANSPDRTAKLQYIGGGEDRETTASLSLSVEVADGHSGGVDTAAVTVSVTGVNEKPTANAGSDQTVTPTSDASQRVTLDGRGSTDPESHSLTYAWTAPAGVTLQSANTARPWFSPHIAAGDYDFSLTVTDIPGGSNFPLSSTPDRVRVTVGHGTPYFKNASGTVITSQNLSIKHGAEASTNVGSPVLASDPNGGTIASYSLADTTASSGHAANFQVSNGGQISVASGKTLSTLTSYAVTLTAGKGSGATALSGSIALTIAVSASDKPVLSAAISDLPLARGASSTITLSNHFSDSDSTLSYSATSDNTKVLTVAVSNAGVLTLTAKSDAGGSADVTVTASDSLASVEDSFTVTVANNAPTVSAAIADQSNLTIGDSVAITLSDHFTDTDSGDILTYSHSLTPANSGVATAAQTSVGGKPTLTLSVASKGSLTVAVTATDNGGTASVSDSFALTVTNTTPTTVGSMPTQLVPPGSSIASIDLSPYFDDAEGKNSLTYTASSSDTSTVTTSVSTERLTITAPPLPAANSATVTVTATDDRNKTATQTFSVEIRDVAPSFSGTPVGNQSYTKGKAASLTLPAATGGNGALSYSLAPSVPGLTFNAGTRTLAGTPTALGTTTMTYTAADSDSNSKASDLASQTFDIVVRSAPVFTDTSLHGSTLNLVTNTPGFRLQLPLAKPNLGTPPLTYNLSGDLPQGLQYNGANHSLTGSPAQAGSYPNLVWSITDSQGASASLTFTIVVAQNSRPSFASADQPLTALAKTSFQIALPTASGGNGTLTYSLTGLPAGTSFDDSAHTLNGTLADATSHSLTLHVQDDDSDKSAGDSATLALTLRVQPNLCDRTQQVWEALQANGQSPPDRCDASATAEDLRRHLVLSIDDSTLTDLQAGDFGGLVNLQTLIVEGTQLASLPANLFANLPKLETLVLSGNRLSSLPDGLFVASNAAGAGAAGAGFNAAIGSSSVPKLAFLDLSDNALNSLPAGLFSGLNSGLLTLDLSGNPGAPFVLSIELQQVALPAGGAYDPQTDVNLRARLSMTAPLQLSLPLVLSDPTAATLSCAALTVAVGASQSDSCVLRLIGQQAVQVALASSLALPVEYQGLRLQIGDPLQLSTSRAADTAFQQQMLARNALTVATSVARSIGERMNYWKNGSPAGLQIGTNSGGSSFALPLDRLDAEQGANGTLAIWGQSLKGELDSRDQELNFSGDVPTLHLGVDGRLGDNLVLGMVVSQASASFDFSAAQNLSGQYDSDLQSFHPYVGWNSGPVQLWASVGSGSGDLTLGVAGGDGLSDTASLSTVQLGLVAPLLKGSTKLWVQADFTQAGMQLDSGMSADASQARLALRVAHSFRFRGGGALTPRLEVASRSDGGDIQGGNGQETGYSLNYDSGAGFTLGLGGRQLLSSVSLDPTQDSYEEAGSWLAVEYRAGDDGRGLSLALRPAEGITESGLQRLWQQPARPTAATLRAADNSQLAAELGYGLATGSGALWTPRGALLQGQDGQRQWRLGVALGVGDGMDMAVEGEWTDDAGKAATPLLKAATPMLKVRGQWRF